MNSRKLFPRVLFEGKSNDTKTTEEALSTDVCDVKEPDQSRTPRKSLKKRSLSMKRLSIASKSVHQVRQKGSEVIVQSSPSDAEYIALSRSSVFTGKLCTIVWLTFLLL